MSWSDDGPSEMNHRVEVHVDGKKEWRNIESIDMETHDINPVLRDGEGVVRTVCGQIHIIRVRY